MVRGVNFAAEGNPARSLILKVKGTGSVEVRVGDLERESAAFAEFSSDKEQTIVVPITGEELNAFEPNLYFVFVSNTDAEVLSWQFSSLTVEEATDIVEIESDAEGLMEDGAAYYSVSGVRLARPEKGVNIIRMRDGKVLKRVNR